MKRLPILLAVTVACAATFAQSPSDKPLTQEELLKQIETFNPMKGSVTAAASGSNAATSPLLLPPNAPRELPKGTTSNAIAPGSQAVASISPGTPGTIIGPGTAAPPGEKKAKGPTIIDALEATFDQRANVAVFVGDVVVKDPEFNVWCDQLTAYLKHDDNSAPAANGAKTTPKQATPKPAAAKPGTPNPAGGTPAPKKGGGLDHAIAIKTSERRVKITQDKVDAETGKIKHGIGFADWATYDAKTGDIVLHGSPDVTQDEDRCIATAPQTVITLNRDGHMIAKGPHRTFIVDDESRDANATNPPATPRPAATPDPGARSPQ